MAGLEVDGLQWDVAKRSKARGNLHLLVCELAVWNKIKNVRLSSTRKMDEVAVEAKVRMLRAESLRLR